MNTDLKDAPTIESNWNVHCYINEYIRFADQKASALVGVSTAVIGAMVWADLPKTLKANPFTLNGTFIAISFVVLFIAFGVACWAMYPRLVSLRSNKPKIESTNLSPIYFGHIQKRKIENYVIEVTALTDHDWIIAVAEHNWQLSNIAQFKYHYVGISARLWVLGSALALIMVFANL